MALNRLFAGSPENNRELPVPVGTVSGTAVKVENYVGVTLTDRGDASRTEAQGNGRTVTYPSGGIGNADDSATVAQDGVFILPVTGVTAATKRGTPVYITTAGSLSLTEGTNTRFGLVYGINNTAAATAVDVGA